MTGPSGRRGRDFGKRRNFLRENLLYLKEVEKRLRKKKVRSAPSEAESLLRHFGKMSRLDFFTGEKPIPPKARKAVQKALQERVKGAPLSYLMKKAEFFGHVFYVSKDTLIPRPETEILVQETLKILDRFYPPVFSSPKILDVGTGSGCVALSLTIKRPDSRMTALDISPRALSVVRKNMEFHGLRKKIKCVESDLFSFFGEKEKSHWDVIVSNPPYVPAEDFPTLSKEVLSEPRIALDGGSRGLRIILALLEKAPYFLKKEGWLLLEIGKGHSQALAKRLLKGGVFNNFCFVKDPAGIERVLIARKK